MATRDALILAVLVFNILMPTLAYGFTTLASAGNESVAGIFDPDLLLLAGINIENSTTHTVEWETDWVEYELSDATYRLRWQEDQAFGALFDNGPGFALEKRVNPIDLLFGTWLFPLHLKFENSSGVAAMEILDNATLVEAYEATYQWAKIGVEGTDKLLIFTANSTISPTFEDAVMVNGTVIATFADLVGEEISINGFIEFFADTLIGNNLYGLPSVFSWIMRLITGISALALAWFIKDMISL